MKPGEYVDYWNIEMEEGNSEDDIMKIARKLIRMNDEIGHQSCKAPQYML